MKRKRAPRHLRFEDSRRRSLKWYASRHDIHDPKRWSHPGLALIVRNSHTNGIRIPRSFRKYLTST